MIETFMRKRLGGEVERWMGVSHQMRDRWGLAEMGVCCGWRSRLCRSWGEQHGAPGARGRQRGGLLGNFLLISDESFPRFPQSLSWLSFPLGSHGVICLRSFLLNCEISREEAVSHVGVPSISHHVNLWKMVLLELLPSHPFLSLPAAASTCISFSNLNYQCFLDRKLALHCLSCLP